MSRGKRQSRELHHFLMTRFPKAFPPHYDHIRALKVGIEQDILARLEESVDPALLRRVLANHTERAGYLLALLHGKGDWRYDLDGKPVEKVDEAAKAEAARKLDALQQRQQAHSIRYRAHLAREQALQAAKAQRIAERERKAEEKRRRREQHEQNRLRKLARQPQTTSAAPAKPTPTITIKKRRPVPPKDFKK